MVPPIWVRETSGIKMINEFGESGANSAEWASVGAAVALILWNASQKAYRLHRGRSWPILAPPFGIQDRCLGMEPFVLLPT